MSITAAALIGGAALSGIASMAGAQLDYQHNYALQKDAQTFNAQEALKQREFEASQAQLARDFQASQRDTAIKSQLDQMKAAGINVGALGAAGSVTGVSTPGATSAHGSSASSGMNSSNAFGVAASSFQKAVSDSISSVIKANKKEFNQMLTENVYDAAGKLVQSVSVRS